jgi:mono/diheme cytochrome c family protein
MRLSPALAALAAVTATLSAGGSAAQTSNWIKPPPGAQEYQHYCIACHSAPGRVGPELSKVFVENREAVIRDKIINGSGTMPGFKYNLSNQQVDLIMTYLKGLDNPPKVIGMKRAVK